MQRFVVMTVIVLGLTLRAASGVDEQMIKFADCPPAARKTIQAEAKGAKIESVTKNHEDEETTYWVEVPIGEHTYTIAVHEDGTLTEMSLVVDDKELPLDQCPAPVKETIGREALGAKVDAVTKDRKYGTIVYETVVEHKARKYQIVVAEDGTLVEKVLVIDDEEIDLAACPAPVRKTLQDQAKGGKIGDITRSTGIAKPTFEAEIEVHGKIYLIEVDEAGLLLAKSLEAAAE